MSELKTATRTLRGVTYKVREMRGTERFKCADVEEKEGMVGMAGYIIKRCVVEPDDFNPDNAPASVVSVLVNEVIKMSEISGADLEDAEKKPAAVPTLDTGTG